MKHSLPASSIRVRTIVLGSAMGIVAALGAVCTAQENWYTHSFFLLHEDHTTDLRSCTWAYFVVPIAMK